MRTLRFLAYSTAIFAYAIIVLGFIVRITESGMGCGDDWPLCNGRLIPSFDSAEVVIEWGHRIAALTLSVLTVLLVITAHKLRDLPGGSGPGGTFRPALWVAGLLLLQSLLGALAVRLELPPHTVVLHLGTGLALLAALIVLGLRAGVHGGVTQPPESLARGTGGIIAALVLSAAVVLMGGITAMTGAAVSCQGFPLCNGQLWPTAGGSGLPHIHWTHRLLAYGLFFHLLGLALGLGRRGASARVQSAAWLAFGLAIAQVTAGAIMVLTILPPVWRGIHAALGAGVWVGLVWLTWLVAGTAQRHRAAEAAASQ
jgi:heme A synthase